MHFSIEHGASGWGATRTKTLRSCWMPLQEQMLWEQIIRESPAGASLLQIPETARQAMETWRLMVEYRLPVDGSFEASGRLGGVCRVGRASFGDGARRIAGWKERGLSDFLRDRIAAGEVHGSSAVYVAGFDEMTPQQAEFMTALGNWRAVEMPNYSPALERRKLRDSSDGDPQRGGLGSQAARGGSRSTNRHYCCARSHALAAQSGTDFWRSSGGTRSRAGVSPFRRAVASPNIQWCAPLFSCWNSHWASCPCRAPECYCDRPFWAARKRNGVSAHSWTPSCARTAFGMYLCRACAKTRRSCPELQRVLRRVEKQLRKLPQEQPPSEWSRGIAGFAGSFRLAGRPHSQQPRISNH